MSMETQAITRVKIIVVKKGRKCKDRQQSGEDRGWEQGHESASASASRHVAFQHPWEDARDQFLFWELSQNCTEPFPSLTLFFLPFPPTAAAPANDTDNDGTSLLADYGFLDTLKKEFILISHNCMYSLPKRPFARSAFSPSLPARTGE